MPKDKAEMMRRVREERREKGLVEFRAWVTPALKARLEKIVINEAEQGEKRDEVSLGVEVIAENKGST